MPWSYTPGGTSSKDKVRRLIGDVHQDDPLIQDEEIEGFLTETPNVYASAANCAESIAAEFARDVSMSFEGTSIQAQIRMQHYFDLADRLSSQVGSSSLPATLPGGSPSDYSEDHQEPIFEVGMHDNKGTVYSSGSNVAGG